MENLFDVLPEKEQKMIENYIDTYAFHESGARNVSVRYLLREWAEQKQSLYTIFGQKLILSKKVSFSKDIEEISEDISRSLRDRDCAMSTFYENYYKIMDEHFPSYFGMRRYVLDLVDTYALATNVYNGDTFELPGPNDGDKPLKIQHNCKISRALGKIAQLYNIPGFEEFRIEHSQCLNQKALSGNLCLSIHPLDYMTMSDNECGWSSCMSWQEDGCYRQGTVTLMNSPMVVVAYLTSDEPMRLPYDDEWNSKKWRQLFIVHPDIISNVKGYPYKNDNLSKTALQWLKELVSNYYGTTYTNDIVKYDSFEKNYVKELDRDIEIHLGTSVMYNDLSRGQFAYINVEVDKRISFYWSGTPECLGCGELDPYFDDESMLACSNCESHYYCESCEENFYSDEEFHEVDGCWICHGCYLEYTSFDSFTDEPHFDNNMTSVGLTLDGKKIYDMDVYTYEPDIDADHRSSYYGSIYSYAQRPYWGRHYYINAKDLTDYGKRVFHLPDDESEYEEYLDNHYSYSMLPDNVTVRPKRSFSQQVQHIEYESIPAGYEPMPIEIQF